MTRIQGTVVSSILAVSFTFVFIGKMPHHVNGMSPYYSSFRAIESKVFERAEMERQRTAEKLRDQARSKIRKVLLEYKTGLAEEFELQMPELILQESAKYGYDPLFLTALIITESSFYNRAKSHRGALGLMQIRPATGKAIAKEAQIEWKGTPTLFDPGMNIAIGAYYLNKLLDRFGDLSLALEAYNHGPSQLSRYLRKGFRPKKYSQQVNKHYKLIQSLSI
ncbi:MAG: lytic transglycosylase domain-containing protein [Candidatus Nitrohelix vancouverensis]|uniref:Lytic transglycosylase domain-containing protein n=1 Tax=Candidatus Nitrohelix vancouverensis TaxID=2705534 RepID=A0A7T0C5M3_9BACT|nr:MAG: lytic transglycosylase domain-containing protein [Candidatus Nitrohelix vancouverensis]